MEYKNHRHGTIGLKSITQAIRNDRHTQSVHKTNIRNSKRIDQQSHEHRWLQKRSTSSFNRVRNSYEYSKTLKKWFKSLDTDGSGEISTAELVGPLLALGAADTIDDVRYQLSKVDTDGSGQIGFNEFSKLLQSDDDNHDHHPLRTLVSSDKNNDDGNSVACAEDFIPRLRRQAMLQALMSYGSVDHSPRTRTEVEDRKNREKQLQRAELALSFNSVKQEEDEQAPGTNYLKQEEQEVITEGVKLRKRLDASEKSLKLRPNTSAGTVAYYYAAQQNVSNSTTKQVGGGQNDRQQRRRGRQQRSSRKTNTLCTYTYAPGELIPHKTVIKLPPSKKKVRAVQKKSFL